MRKIKYPFDKIAYSIKGKKESWKDWTQNFLILQENTVNSQKHKPSVKGSPKKVQVLASLSCLNNQK